MDRQQFIEKVAEMRALQREYFRHRDRGVLIRSKQAEREVDKFLEQRDGGQLFPPEPEKEA